MRLNPSLTFTLADHIDFAIKRIKEGNNFDYGIAFEMEYLHPDEMYVAKNAVRYLQKKFDVVFPKGETAVIAMHILEAESLKERPEKVELSDDQFYEELLSLIKETFEIDVSLEDFSYYRFVTHIQYLLNRKSKNQEITTDNVEMFNVIKKEYQDTYLFALKIKQLIHSYFGFEIGDEELMYLMLHINRFKVKQIK